MERLESNQNFSNFRTQILDLACGETKIFKLLSSLDTCPEGTLILIGLITSPVTHISSDDILRRLQASAGMNIASCINVVQPQAFLRSPNVSRYASSVSSPLSFSFGHSNRLGFETWVGACHEVLHAGQMSRKNLIAIIDSPSPSDLRSTDESNIQPYIELVNSAADVVRLLPNNLWLNAEIMDSIIASTESTSFNSKASLFGLRDTFPERLSQQLDIVPSLQSFHVAVPKDHTRWDLERLQLLLRKCFPKAILSNTLPSDDSYLPETQGLTGIQLALFLAKVKVFSERKRQKGLTQFQGLVQQFDELEISSVNSGILSVHAVHRIPSKESSSSVSSAWKLLLLQSSSVPASNRSNIPPISFIFLAVSQLRMCLFFTNSLRHAFLILSKSVIFSLTRMSLNPLIL